MTSFWPSGFKLDDVSSPREILRQAEAEWSKNSQSLLTLVIQETESTNGHQMLIVHAKHNPSQRTSSLFSILHRKDAPYPVRIQPRDNELPDIFKKNYYRPGIKDNSAMSFVTGKEVTNHWVADTPGEFRSLLKDAFNLGNVKSEILSLITVQDASPASDEELQ